MHHFITGVAGFVGSQLADSLLADGNRVSGMDDFSLGRRDFLTGAEKTGQFNLFEGDCSDTAQTTAALRGARQQAGPPDLIWHLAANSDVSAGVEDVTIDFSRTLKTSFALLRAAKSEGLGAIVFASTSAVYGDREDLLTEDSGPLLPISNYGATKLGSEALFSAAAESFLRKVWIFRFPNVVGPRLTHGAIFDFIRQLRGAASSLRVLGDGTQTKPYLHINELLQAMRFIVANANARRNVYNIGPEGQGTSVAFIAEQVIARFRPGIAIDYSGGDRGWVGDVPRFRYSTEKLARLGWHPSLSSDAAVSRAVREIASSFA